MPQHSRRDFLKLAGLTTAAGSLSLSDLLAQPSVPTGKGSIPFDFGIASYTFRSFTLDQAIEMTKRLGIMKMTLKDMHLPMKSTDEEMKTALGKMKSAGVELSSCGVVYMQTEEEVHVAFAYARNAGIKIVVGVPYPPLLALAEQKVKETGISLAIHNHGPSDRPYPGPWDIYSAIEKMDRRMGLCFDITHTQRAGLDPSSELERCFDKVLDIHMKDVSSADANGKTVEIGRGVIDIPRFFKTLLKLKYSRTIHFEHEENQKDPLPSVAESVGYVRGLLASM
jgi:sugar phosphate isomerase/epimerase